MNSLIKYINKKNPNEIWLLWGKSAQSRVIPLINDNYILSTHSRLQSFINENCFSKISNINWLGV